MDYRAQICVLIACIERSIKSKPDYREMERSIGFSYRHMREIFRRVMTVSLARYIVARKIANAAFTRR
ncbi:MAG: hypothetical protein LBI27_02435 [Clostridiales bacterium]|jgi:methylphosphotriester-DNA--protein-cysteine methyltransferase|nr:hypothetical protein [Clostridiales bacterium]